MQEANQLSLEGFAACSGGYLASQENPCGIKVKMRIDEYKELVWEAVIPLKVLYPRSQLSKSDAGHPVSVCFAIRGFKGKSAKGESGSSPGMNDGMGGAGRNSAMQGGRSGMRMPANDPLQHLYESTKTWKQFSLAFQ